MTEAALRRGALDSGGALVDGNAIAVGDTPRDVTAGHGAGIRVVGVATGSYKVDQLQQAGADWALSQASDGFPVDIPDPGPGIFPSLGQMIASGCARS